MSNRVAGEGRRARDSRWVERAARAGLVAFGVVHLMIGWLAVQLALGGGGGRASSSGALRELAQQPFGGVLVGAIAVGMVLLVVWQGLEAVVGRPGDEGFSDVRHRVAAGGRAVVYGVIGASAVQVAAGSGSGGSGTDSLTARLMDLPGGQVLVGLVAIGIVAVGVVLVVRGVTDRFTEDLDPRGTTGRSGDVCRWLGRVGYAAKGVALGVVGLLFGYAALTHDPGKSGGLDQALREVLDQPFGPFLLTAMGVGFACFGLFCLAWARYFSHRRGDPS